MASCTSLPTEQGIAFNVKNTFVNVESDDEEDTEPQPACMPRSHTEPLSRKGSRETEYCSQDGQDSEDSSQPTFSRQHSRSIDGEGADNVAPLAGRTGFTVKNTFIATLDEDEEQPLTLSRSHTEVPSRRPSILDEDEQDESEEEQQSDQEQAEEGRVTVKNTFIDISDNIQPAGSARRHTAFPSRGASLFEECEPEDVKDEDVPDGSPLLGAGVESVPVDSLMPRTPTPWGTRSQPPAFFPGEMQPREAQPTEARPAGAKPAGAAEQRGRAAVPPGVAGQRQLVLVAQDAAPTQGMRLPQQQQQQQQVNHGGALAPIIALATDNSLAVTQNHVACRVEWTVDVKKIRGSEKNIVSMPFDVVLLPGTDPVVFKLMLYPKVAAGSGGSSFRRAKGVGCVQLKCCSDIPQRAKRATAVSVGVGSKGGVQGRGPFGHRFHSSSMFNLPRDQADWNFSAAVEKSKASFTVTVEIAPLE